MLLEVKIMGNTPEEEFIIKVLSEAGEMSYKELNEKCSEKFEGSRLILKKMKEKGIVSFAGAIPGFSSIIKFIKPEDREATIKKMMFEAKKMGPGAPTEEQYYVVKILKDHDGEMNYKELNEIYTEKYEGLRISLKKRLVAEDSF